RLASTVAIPNLFIENSSWNIDERRSRSGRDRSLADFGGVVPLEPELADHPVDLRARISLAVEVPCERSGVRTVRSGPAPRRFERPRPIVGGLAQRRVDRRSLRALPPQLRRHATARESFPAPQALRLLGSQTQIVEMAELGESRERHVDLRFVVSL